MMIHKITPSVKKYSYNLSNYNFLLKSLNQSSAVARQLRLNLKFKPVVVLFKEKLKREIANFESGLEILLFLISKK